LKVIAWLIVAFMGLAMLLAGLILMSQERIMPVYADEKKIGYTLQYPYWQLGYGLVLIGIIVFVATLILVIFTSLERRLKKEN